MNTTREWVTASDAYLFAVNTGDFYKAQCSMARQEKTLKVWMNHVLWNVMPRYRKEVTPDDPDARFYLHDDDVREVAKRLKSYYANHVKEAQAW